MSEVSGNSQHESKPEAYVKEQKGQKEKEKAKEIEKGKIIVQYKKGWYDITNFDHPGKSAGVDLSDYHLKNIDDEVDNAHATDEPFQILLQAKKKPDGFKGIKYLGQVI